MCLYSLIQHATAPSIVTNIETLLSLRTVSNKNRAPRLIKKVKTDKNKRETMSTNRSNGK